MQARRLLSSGTQFFARTPVNISHSQVHDAHKHLLKPDFLKLLRSISGQFQPEYRGLLAERQRLQSQYNAKKLPLDYRKDTAWIREDKSWRAPEIVPELLQRHVEITGPAGDAKMVINALNSCADGYMSDFEDSQAPHWVGVMQGHDNLY